MNSLDENLIILGSILKVNMIKGNFYFFDVDVDSYLYLNILCDVV